MTYHRKKNILMGIEEFVSEFRRKLEIVVKSVSHIEFNSFPRGSCFASSVLLNSYLIKNGYGRFNIVSAKKNNHSHAWLSNNEVFIDITADQFKDQIEKVIVVKKDLTYWHATFDLKEERAIDMYDFFNFNLMEIEKMINDLN